MASSWYGYLSDIPTIWNGADKIQESYQSWKNFTQEENEDSQLIWRLIIKKFPLTAHEIYWRKQKQIEEEIKKLQEKAEGEISLTSIAEENRLKAELEEEHREITNFINNVLRNNLIENIVEAINKSWDKNELYDSNKEEALGPNWKEELQSFSSLEELNKEKKRLNSLINSKVEELKHTALPRNLGKTLGMGSGVGSPPDKKNPETKTKNQRKSIAVKISPSWAFDLSGFPVTIPIERVQVEGNFYQQLVLEKIPGSGDEFLREARDKRVWVLFRAKEIEKRDGILSIKFPSILENESWLITEDEVRKINANLSESQKALIEKITQRSEKLEKSKVTFLNEISEEHFKGDMASLFGRVGAGTGDIFNQKGLSYLLFEENLLKGRTDREIGEILKFYGFEERNQADYQGYINSAEKEADFEEQKNFLLQLIASHYLGKLPFGFNKADGEQKFFKAIPQLQPGLKNLLSPSQSQALKESSELGELIKTSPDNAWKTQKLLTELTCLQEIAKYNQGRSGKVYEKAFNKVAGKVQNTKIEFPQICSLVNGLEVGGLVEILTNWEKALAYVEGEKATENKVVKKLNKFIEQIKELGIDLRIENITEESIIKEIKETSGGIETRSWDDISPESVEYEPAAIEYLKEKIVEVSKIAGINAETLSSLNTLEAIENLIQEKTTEITNSIIVLGGMGEGKSTLLNTLIGRENEFKEEDSSSVEEKEIQKAVWEVGDSQYQVVEIPDFKEKSLSNDYRNRIALETSELIKKAKETGKLPQILLVVGGRATQKQTELFRFLRELLTEEELRQCLFLVRTKFPSFKNKERCQQEHAEYKQENEKFAEISAAIQGVIHVDNPSLEEEEYRERFQGVRQACQEKLLSALGIKLSAAGWERVFAGIELKPGENLPEIIADWQRTGFTDPAEAFQAHNRGYKPRNFYQKDREGNIELIGDGKTFCPSAFFSGKRSGGRNLYCPAGFTFNKAIEAERTALWGDQKEAWEEFHQKLANEGVITLHFSNIYWVDLIRRNGYLPELNGFTLEDRPKGENTKIWYEVFSPFHWPKEAADLYAPFRKKVFNKSLTTNSLWDSFLPPLSDERESPVQLLNRRISEYLLAAKRNSTEIKARIKQIERVIISVEAIQKNSHNEAWTLKELTNEKLSTLFYDARLENKEAAEGLQKVLTAIQDILTIEENEINDLVKKAREKSNAELNNWEAGLISKSPEVTEVLEDNNLYNLIEKAGTKVRMLFWLDVESATTKEALQNCYDNYERVRREANPERSSVLVNIYGENYTARFIENWQKISAWKILDSWKDWLNEPEKLNSPENRNTKRNIQKQIKSYEPYQNWVATKINEEEVRKIDALKKAVGLEEDNLLRTIEISDDIPEGEARAEIAKQLELKLRCKAKIEEEFGSLGSFANLSETITKNRTELIKEADSYLLHDYLMHISDNFDSLLVNIDENRAKISFFALQVQKIRSDEISKQNKEILEEFRWGLENPEKSKMLWEIDLTREQLEKEIKWFYEGFYEKTDEEKEKIEESSDLDECEKEYKKARNILVAYANQHLTEFADLGKREDRGSDELAIKISSLKDIPDESLENYLASFPLSHLPETTNSLGAIVKLKAQEIAEKKKKRAIDNIRQTYAELRAIEKLNLSLFYNSISEDDLNLEAAEEWEEIENVYLNKAREIKNQVVEKINNFLANEIPVKITDLELEEVCVESDLNNWFKNIKVRELTNKVKEIVAKIKVEKDWGLFFAPTEIPELEQSEWKRILGKENLVIAQNLHAQGWTKIDAPEYKIGAGGKISGYLGTDDFAGTEVEKKELDVVIAILEEIDVARTDDYEKLVESDLSDSIFQRIKNLDLTKLGALADLSIRAEKERESKIRSIWTATGLIEPVLTEAKDNYLPAEISAKKYQGIEINHGTNEEKTDIENFRQVFPDENKVPPQQEFNLGDIDTEGKYRGRAVGNQTKTQIEETITDDEYIEGFGGVSPSPTREEIIEWRKTGLAASLARQYYVQNWVNIDIRPDPSDSGKKKAYYKGEYFGPAQNKQELEYITYFRQEVGQPERDNDRNSTITEDIPKGYYSKKISSETAAEAYTANKTKHKKDYKKINANEISENGTIEINEKVYNLKTENGLREAQTAKKLNYILDLPENASELRNNKKNSLQKIITKYPTNAASRRKTGWTNYGTKLTLNLLHLIAIQEIETYWNLGDLPALDIFLNGSGFVIGGNWRANLKSKNGADIGSEVTRLKKLIFRKNFWDQAPDLTIDESVIDPYFGKSLTGQQVFFVYNPNNETERILADEIQPNGTVEIGSDIYDLKNNYDLDQVRNLKKTAWINQKQEEAINYIENYWDTNQAGGEINQKVRHDVLGNHWKINLRNKATPTDIVAEQNRLEGLIDKEKAFEIAFKNALSKTKNGDDWDPTLSPTEQTLFDSLAVHATELGTPDKIKITQELLTYLREIKRDKLDNWVDDKSQIEADIKTLNYAGYNNLENFLNSGSKAEKEAIWELVDRILTNIPTNLQERNLELYSLWNEFFTGNLGIDTEAKKITWINSDLEIELNLDPLPMAFISEPQAVFNKGWRYGEDNIVGKTATYETNLDGQKIITNNIDILKVNKGELHKVHEILTELRNADINHVNNLAPDGPVAQKIGRLTGELPPNKKTELLTEMNTYYNGLLTETTAQTRLTNALNLPANTEVEKQAKRTELQAIKSSYPVGTPAERKVWAQGNNAVRVEAALTALQDKQDKPCPQPQPSPSSPKTLVEVLAEVKTKNEQGENWTLPTEEVKKVFDNPQLVATPEESQKIKNVQEAQKILTKVDQAEKLIKKFDQDKENVSPQQIESLLKELQTYQNSNSVASQVVKEQVDKAISNLQKLQNQLSTSTPQEVGWKDWQKWVLGVGILTGAVLVVSLVAKLVNSQAKKKAKS